MQVFVLKLHPGLLLRYHNSVKYGILQYIRKHHNFRKSWLVWEKASLTVFLFDTHTNILVFI